MNSDVSQKLDALRRMLEGDDDDKSAAGVERLKSAEVGYMELPMKVSGFACGGCASYKPDRSFCENKKVQTNVSAGSGCCNLFYPVAKEPVPPERWQAKQVKKELKGATS